MSKLILHWNPGPLRKANRQRILDNIFDYVDDYGHQSKMRQKTKQIMDIYWMVKHHENKGGGTKDDHAEEWLCDAIDSWKKSGFKWGAEAYWGDDDYGDEYHESYLTKWFYDILDGLTDDEHGELHKAYMCKSKKSFSTVLKQLGRYKEVMEVVKMIEQDELGGTLEMMMFDSSQYAKADTLFKSHVAPYGRKNAFIAMDDMDSEMPRLDELYLFTPEALVDIIKVAKIDITDGFKVFESDNGDLYVRLARDKKPRIVLRNINSIIKSANCTPLTSVRVKMTPSLLETVNVVKGEQGKTDEDAAAKEKEVIPFLVHVVDDIDCAGFEFMSKVAEEKLDKSMRLDDFIKEVSSFVHIDFELDPDEEVLEETEEEMCA